MSIFWIIAGVGILLYGAMIVFGFVKTDVSKDSLVDKTYLSERSRYFIGRYNAGLQFMLGGTAMVWLGWMLLLS